MAVTVEPPDGRGPSTPPANGGPIDVLDVADVCPYLIAADGAWRSARPSRDHRCGAIAPAPVLTPEKQRQLCLVAAHTTCATFRAAHTRSLGPPGPGPRETAPEPLWPIARTAPVVLESARPSLASLPGIPDRLSGQLVLAVLMVVAFVAVVLARTTSPGPAATVAPSATPVVTVRPTARPTVRPTPSPSVSASVSAAASPSASTAAAPSPQTYTVRRGDTLLAIAERFGVTVRALSAANGITDPSLLRIGQVLTIPSG
jgi:LysM repeat protein